MEINTENSFEIVLEEIGFITNEQIRIMKYNAEMEDRRLRLLEFIKRRENLRISKEAQTNLILNVSNMELKVLRTPEGFHNKDVEVADKKKCRYDNKGYCKYQKCVGSDIPVQFVTNSLRMESVRLDIVARIGTQRVVNTGKEIRKDVSGDKYADTCISTTNLKKEWKKTVKKKVWAQ